MSVVCIPGERLGTVDNFKPGKGTYVRNGFIYSSIAGYKRKHQVADSQHEELEVVCQEQSTTVPDVGSIVTVKIMDVNPRQCRCTILGVEGKSLRETFHGVVRKENIRATEKDKVEVYKSYRPGDIVLAKVLSLGDARSYLLTTAENELGVVLAQSEAGVNMVPISWCEMICPQTHIKELRKVAKVQPQYIQQT